MRFIIFGGDGFCGWPTSLHLAANGHEVLIVDNLVRRKIDQDLGSNSLTEIAQIDDRVSTARKVIGNIDFQLIDVAREPERVRQLIKEFQPDTVVQFAEQRAAPYSMLGDDERRYTVDNNISGTHNICSALVDHAPSCHLIHLGTMGVYGYSKDFGSIPEGYLDIKIKSTEKDVDILYPANPGSIYHMTKCLDQLIFQFYAKNWNLRVMTTPRYSLGVNTDQTKKDPVLVNRFDYDGIYGTVLNRFCRKLQTDFRSRFMVQIQSRAFIHISDTAKCVEIAALSKKYENNRVTIYNQVSEFGRFRIGKTRWELV